MFWFTSRDGWMLYMGRDKYENDQLIQYSFPEDVWFHVDEVSSAHIYLRLGPGMTIESIPPKTLEDCVQLVKANSISGCKMSTVTVIFTYVSNLRKDETTMDTGTVGFHDMKAVRNVPNVSRDTAIVNRIEKTKTEKTIRDLQAERVRHDAEVRAQKKADVLKQHKAQEDAERKLKEEKEQREYTTVMKAANMHSNAMSQQTVTEYEDDFM